MKKWCLSVNLFFCCFLLNCGGSGSDSGGNTRDPDQTPPPELTFEIAGSGSVSPSQITLPTQESVAITLVPDSGFSVESAAGCNGALAGNIFTIPVRSTSCAVSITFKENDTGDSSSLFVANSFSFDGFTFTYHLHSPNTAEGKLYPLIFAAHGTAEGIVAGDGSVENPHLVYGIGEKIGRPIASGWVQPAVREKFPAFVAAPLIPLIADAQWYDDNLIAIFAALIEDLVSNHQIDPDRVHLTGHSVGASVAWTAPFLLPDTFASISPKAGWFDRLGSAANPEPIRDITDKLAVYERTAIWAFDHVNDPERTLENSQLTRRLAERGLDFQFFSETVSDESRLALTQTVAQPFMHIALDLTQPCDSLCHFMGADVAGREELYYQWVYQQRRIQNERLRLQLIQRVNDTLTLEFQVSTAQEGHQVRVWQKDDNSQWQQLTAVSAMLNGLETQLLPNIEGAKQILIQAVDDEGRAYARRTATFEL